MAVDPSSPLDPRDAAARADPETFSAFVEALDNCLAYFRDQHAQFGLVENQSLQEKAKSELSLGYLWGGVETWMQSAMIDDQSLRLDAFGRVLEELFGPECERLFLNAVYHLQSAGRSFEMGVQLGREDVLEVLHRRLEDGGTNFGPTWVGLLTKLA